MNTANGDETGIVDLLPNDSQHGNQGFPCRMDIYRLGEQWKGRLKLHQLFMSIGGRQAQTVVGQWPCCYVEKLHQVLRSDVEHFSPTMQFCYGSPGDAVRCILLIRQPHQYARINEVGHYS